LNLDIFDNYFNEPVIKRLSVEALGSCKIIGKVVLLDDLEERRIVVCRARLLNESSES